MMQKRSIWDVLANWKVWCKDCKHYNAGFECLIEGYGIERDEDWYCADAERRTDE